jgi:hypothetical protein
MTSTQQVQDLIKPLLGQSAWSVHGGVGSMLTLEFGAPHIRIREPIVPRAATSERRFNIVIASEAKQSSTVTSAVDCFVAALLALTILFMSHGQ